MKVLFLAPQTFFVERGTPIAVRLALEVLQERDDLEVDLLTYHRGKDIEFKSIKHHRMWAPKFLKQAGPGISILKLIHDCFFIFAAFKLIWQNRKEQYNLIHAVEEAVFIGRLLKFFLGIPYIYDMDSSMAQQVTEKWAPIRFIQPILNACEKFAVKGSIAVVPVCDALAVIANDHGSRMTQILRDIPLSGFDENDQTKINLRAELKLSQDSKIILYVGNLEPYQGIDLLLESFKQLPDLGNTYLVIVGGSQVFQEEYKNKIAKFGLTGKAIMAGVRPVNSLADYLQEATVLVSPRIKGNNTPMKIYSYLHSGVATIATRLPTHTQVMTDDIAMLVNPNPKDFSQGLKALLNDGNYAKELGAKAKAYAEKHYTFEVFQRDLNRLYDQLKGAKNQPSVQQGLQFS